MQRSGGPHRNRHPNTEEEPECRGNTEGLNLWSQCWVLPAQPEKLSPATKTCAMGG